MYECRAFTENSISDTFYFVAKLIYINILLKKYWNNYAINFQIFPDWDYSYPILRLVKFLTRVLRKVFFKITSVLHRRQVKIYNVCVI